MQGTNKIEEKDISIEVTPSSPYALAEGETRLFIQLRLQGHDIAAEQPRTRLNTGIVLDRSGSMRGSKLQRAKEAVEFIVNNLTSEDVLALTVYDNRVETIVPAKQLTDRTAIISKLRAIRDRGSTDLHGGLIEGAKQVESKKQLELRNMLLLLSDGLANVGVTDPTQIRKSAKHIYEGGIGISTFGVGDDFDEDLMVGIADDGGGTFHFIATADDIPKAIEQEFEGLLATSAFNIEATWDELSGIRIQRALGVPYEDRLKRETKLGNLRAGNEFLVILDVVIPVGAPADVASEIVTFTIEWLPHSDPTTSKRLSIPCEITYTTDEEKLATENEKILENVHILEAAQVQYEAMQLADRGDFLAAQNTMKAFQSKLNLSVTEDSSPELKQLQLENEEAMENILQEEKYTKRARKEYRSKMYAMRKRI